MLLSLLADQERRRTSAVIQGGQSHGNAGPRWDCLCRLRCGATAHRPSRRPAALHGRLVRDRQHSDLRREGRLESSEAASACEEVVTRVMERLASFDEASITRLLGDAVVGLGIRTFVRDVVAPLVYRVAARWAEGNQSIREEHLLTGTLRNLLGGLLRGRTTTGRPIVLATPAGERHEISVLSVALLARDAGSTVVHLGVDLPAADIASAAGRARAHCGLEHRRRPRPYSRDPGGGSPSGGPAAGMRVVVGGRGGRRGGIGDQVFSRAGARHPVCDRERTRPVARGNHGVTTTSNFGTP